MNFLTRNFHAHTLLDLNARNSTKSGREAVRFSPKRLNHMKLMKLCRSVDRGTIVLLEKCYIFVENKTIKIFFLFFHK